MVYLYIVLSTIIWSLFPIFNYFFKDSVNPFNASMISCFFAVLLHSFFLSEGKIQRAIKRIKDEKLLIFFISLFSLSTPIIFSLSLKYLDPIIATLVFSSSPIFSFFILNKILYNKISYLSVKMMYILFMSLIAFGLMFYKEIQIVMMGSINFSILGILLSLMGVIFTSSTTPLVGLLARKNSQINEIGVIESLFSVGIIRLFLSIIIGVFVGDLYNFSYEDFIFGLIFGTVFYGVAALLNAFSSSMAKSATITLIMLSSNPLSIFFLYIFIDDIQLELLPLLSLIFLFLANSYDLLKSVFAKVLKKNKVYDLNTN